MDEIRSVAVGIRDCTLRKDTHSLTRVIRSLTGLDIITRTCFILDSFFYFQLCGSDALSRSQVDVNRVVRQLKLSVASNTACMTFDLGT